MNTSNAQVLDKKMLDYLILQTVAEMKLNRDIRTQIPNSNNIEYVKFYNNYLQNGNFNNIENQFKVAVGAIPNLPGMLNPNNSYEGGAGTHTKLTESQADYFMDNYQIIDYQGNDESGFAVTLFKDLRTNEYTISFRSTEFKEDKARDTLSDAEIALRGTAIGQNTAMVAYIEKLKSNNVISNNTPINVTGYSLGGHLASNFYKMYSNELNLNQLYVFNGPGVGIVKDENYQDVKNEIKNYNALVDIFKILQANIDSTSNTFITDSKNMINGLSQFSGVEKSMAVDFINNTSSFNLSLILNNSQIFHYIGKNFENEVSISDNQPVGYIDNIYNNLFYRSYVDLLTNKFDLKHVSSLSPQDIILGQVREDFYSSDPNKIFFVNGFGANTPNGEIDYNVVANSNYIQNPIKFNIENRPLVEGLGVIGNGDFGNTHSVTAINKTLSLMKFLADIEGKQQIELKRYSDILSASTAEKAGIWILEGEKSNHPLGSLNYGDANSVAFLISTIYKAVSHIYHPDNANENQLYFGQEDIIMENSFTGWSDMEVNNQLEIAKKIITEKLNFAEIVVTLESFSTEYFDQPNPTVDIKSKEVIFNKAMQDNEEGMAYRYAIENLNTVIIHGLDYENMNFNTKVTNSKSEEWYKARIDVLDALIISNVYNHGDLLANKKVMVDDKNQGLGFHTIEEKYHALDPSSMTELEGSFRPGGTHHAKRETDFLSYYEYISASFNYDSRYAPVMTALNAKHTNPIASHNEYKEVQADRSNVDRINFDYNIYFLNPVSTLFHSRKIYDDEKVFINANTDVIYHDLNVGTLTPGYGYIQHYPIQFTTNDNNIKQIRFSIGLEGGNDYIEIDNSEETAIIFSTKGQKTYNLNLKETVIIDPDKSGTITFNGILLDGGDIVGQNLKQQTIMVGGILNLIDYEIVTKDNKGMLKITHQNTDSVIYIEDMNSFGGSNTFGFKDNPQLVLYKTLPLELTDFVSNLTASTISSPSYSSHYNEQAEFLQDMTIDTGLNVSNAVYYKKENSLIMYEKNNPANRVEIQNYFTSAGGIRQYPSKVYSHTVITQDGYQIIYNDTQSKILIQGVSNDTIDWGGVKYDTNVNGYQEVDYRESDRYAIDFSVFSSTVMNKVGNDLVFTQSNKDTLSEFKVKNYFLFDHTANTNFINTKTSDTVLAFNELENHFKLLLNNTNDMFESAEFGNYKFMNGGDGNDLITGSARNEIFQSLGYHSSINHPTTGNKVNSDFRSDGDDMFVGGGGQDTFVFSGYFGNDTILDFSNDDIVYLGAVIHSEQRDYIKRAGNDLFIKTPTNSTLTIKNYFLNIDYKVDSKIKTSNDNYTNSLIFSEALLKSIETFEMDSANFIQSTDYSDWSNDNTILTNEMDNNVEINRNDTVIKGFKHVRMENDGNDEFLINILATQNRTMETNSQNTYIPKNAFRVELEFGFKAGNDILRGAVFKENGLYGDIVNLIDTTNINQVKYRIDKVNGVDKYLVATLSDSSTLKIELDGPIANDAAIFKIGNQIITFEDFMEEILPDEIFGGDESSEYDFSASNNNLVIAGGIRNDVIKTGNGNDMVDAGKGFDVIYMSSGQDEYYFEKGSDIDHFYFKDVRELLDVTFVLDNNYLLSDIGFSYNADKRQIYLKFSDTDGVIFEDSEWIDLLILEDGLKLKYEDDTPIEITEEVELVDTMPFVKKSNLVVGTTSADNIVLNNIYNNVIFGNNGNDTISSNGEVEYDISFLFGGRGNDNIKATDRDVVSVRTGDGTDTITSDTNDYLISILRTTSRVVNGKETLFDLSIASGNNGNDLSIRYGGSSDRLILKDFFTSNTDIGISIFEDNHNTTKTYFINDILDELGLSKSVLQSSGNVVVNKEDVFYDEESDEGHLLGGEISYHYLMNGTAYNNQSSINNIISKMDEQNFYLNKTNQ